ncbi:flippase [Trichlorobacter lovleyi]|uniref:Polysaccharide biosynthesis protein n=1 Tax=Trichlorobacter lovleyi (strain ATCC BAA-1151 / DSM 17278 / SZ) TaxID=398767 RepID=B3E2L8_TRIL1|nr:flippase [Trichlorobacter lovleyi]ACD95675.1 polysaccharide biosynthesis protein [Trichlorobacter lovleyi SZ]
MRSFLRSIFHHTGSPRSNRLQVFTNIGWMCADSLIRGGIGMVISIWLARYLGPEQFGLLNYVVAIAFLFSAVATFGMNSIVVRDLIKEPEQRYHILGTAVVVQVMGGVAAWLCALVTAYIVQRDDMRFVAMIALLGTVSVFKASEVIKFWFESQVQSRYSVWAENGIFLVLATVKAGLILTHAPFMAFIWVLWFEGLFTAGALLLVYSRYVGSSFRWRFQKERWHRLIHDGTPLMVSGLAMAGYMRMDQIMLGKLLNEEAVGIFSAALRLSEAWYFIPIAIMASLFPSVVLAKNAGKLQYVARLEFTHTIMVILALALAIPMTFCADWVVALLFGNRYHGAGMVLALHIWSALFVFLGVASHQWFVTENLQRYVLFRTICGALVNISLNLILIPAYGPVGAAIASLVAHGLVNVVMNAFTPATRSIFRLQIKSLLLMPLWSGSLFKQGNRA